MTIAKSQVVEYSCRILSYKHMYYLKKDLTDTKNSWKNLSAIRNLFTPRNVHNFTRCNSEISFGESRESGIQIGVGVSLLVNQGDEHGFVNTDNFDVTDHPARLKRKCQHLRGFPTVVTYVASVQKCRLFSDDETARRRNADENDEDDDGRSKSATQLARSNGLNDGRSETNKAVLEPTRNIRDIFKLKLRESP